MRPHEWDKVTQNGGFTPSAYSMLFGWQRGDYRSDVTTYHAARVPLNSITSYEGVTKRIISFNHIQQYFSGKESSDYFILFQK